MQTQTEIQAAVFGTPSGNVRGCVTAIVAYTHGPTVIIPSSLLH